MRCWVLVDQRKKMGMSKVLRMCHQRTKTLSILHSFLPTDGHLRLSITFLVQIGANSHHLHPMTPLIHLSVSLLRLRTCQWVIFNNNKQRTIISILKIDHQLSLVDRKRVMVCPATPITTVRWLFLALNLSLVKSQAWLILHLFSITLQDLPICLLEMTAISPPRTFLETGHLRLIPCDLLSHPLSPVKSAHHTHLRPQSLLPAPILVAPQIIPTLPMTKCNSWVCQPVMGKKRGLGEGMKRLKGCTLVVGMVVKSLMGRWTIWTRMWWRKNMARRGCLLVSLHMGSSKTSWLMNLQSSRRWERLGGRKRESTLQLKQALSTWPTLLPGNKITNAFPSPLRRLPPILIGIAESLRPLQSLCPLMADHLFLTLPTTPGVCLHRVCPSRLVWCPLTLVPPHLAAMSQALAWTAHSFLINLLPLPPLWWVWARLRISIFLGHLLFREALFPVVLQLLSMYQCHLRIP